MNWWDQLFQQPGPSNAWRSPFGYPLPPGPGAPPLRPIPNEDYTGGASPFGWIGDDPRLAGAPVQTGGIAPMRPPGQTGRPNQANDRPMFPDESEGPMPWEIARQPQFPRPQSAPTPPAMPWIPSPTSTDEIPGKFGMYQSPAMPFRDNPDMQPPAMPGELPQMPTLRHAGLPAFRELPTNRAIPETIMPMGRPDIHDGGMEGRRMPMMGPSADVDWPYPEGLATQKFGYAPGANPQAPGGATWTPDGNSPGPAAPPFPKEPPANATDASKLPMGITDPRAKPDPSLARFAGQGDDMTRYSRAIAKIESGSPEGNYSIVGPKTTINGRDHYPIGKYQVMDFNVGPWTKEILGKEMTPAEFRASPEAQEAVFKAKFGQYVAKHGPDGAAAMWFSGQPKPTDAKDVTGSTVAGYVSAFRRNLGSDAGQPGRTPRTDVAAAPPSATSSASPGASPPAPAASPEATGLSSAAPTQPGWMERNGLGKDSSFWGFLSQTGAGLGSAAPGENFLSAANRGMAMGNQYLRDRPERELKLEALRGAADERREKVALRKQGAELAKALPAGHPARGFLQFGMWKEALERMGMDPNKLMSIDDKGNVVPNTALIEAQMGIRKAGKTDVNVNIPKMETDIGKLTGDVERIRAMVERDPNNKSLRTALAGAEERLAAESNKEGVAKAQTVASAGIVAKTIDESLKAIESVPTWTTGAIGSVLKNLPGTGARDLAASLDTIKANISFDKLSQMRRESPTGAALGAVSDFENKLLQSTIASLEQSQSKDQLVRNLRRVRAVYDAIIHRGIEPGQEKTLLDGGEAPQSPAKGFIDTGRKMNGKRVFQDPATGKFYRED